jgi:hypothetical protein
MADQHTKHEPVGIAEIGERLDANQTRSVAVRGRALSEPRWSVGGCPRLALAVRHRAVGAPSGFA